MEITETFHAPDRGAWRAWLAEHHEERSEVWLVSWKAATGIASVPYPAAVEEALCFGWIDSVRKSLDHERYAQRYTPRREGSPYSQTNKERLARLVEAGRVIPSVLEQAGNLRPEDYEVPADIAAALRAEPAAWDHWQGFSPAYRRIRAFYVDWARERPDVFEKRLGTLVERTARGRQYGYGIEDFY